MVEIIFPRNSLDRRYRKFALAALLSCSFTAMSFIERALLRGKGTTRKEKEGLTSLIARLRCEFEHVFRIRQIHQKIRLTKDGRPCESTTTYGEIANDLWMNTVCKPLIFRKHFTIDIRSFHCIVLRIYIISVSLKTISRIAS